MANADNPTGLSPIGHIDGSPWNGRTVRCYVVDANNLFVGDPVVLAGSADTDATAPTVAKATAGNTNPIAGVVTSFEQVSPGVHSNINLQQIYRTGSVNTYCNVCFDPTVLYEVQGDSVAAIAYTDVGSCFDLIYTHTGNTTTGLSQVELNSSAKTTSASTYQVRLWRASTVPGNDITSVNARWIVSINLNQLFSAGVNTAGTAIAGGVGV
jgi:hypothetical protein